MEMILFKGTVAVKFPNEWVSDPSAVRFANGDMNCASQIIDFSANGGKIVELWHESRPSWRFLDIEETKKLSWSNKPRYIEPYAVSRTFGHTNKWIILE